MQQLATLIAVGFIALLFWLEHDRRERVSGFVLIPSLWLMVAGSRNLSSWLELSAPVDAGTQYMEGSPLDRNVLMLLLAVSLWVLYRRADRTLALLRSNAHIILFFVYCLISLLWSDFPEVGGRRWIRAIGDLIVLLVVLTEVDWRAALQRVLAWCIFVLVPLSVLFIRYYPGLGRSYGADGSQYWTGVATAKNGLGMLCMTLGLCSVWRLLSLFSDPAARNRKARFVAHAAVCVLVFWLLYISDAKTSFMCFLIGVGLMVLAGLRPVRRYPFLVQSVAIVAIVAAGLVLFGGVGSGALESIGRDSSLTGRTEVWAMVLPYVVDPWLGAGYETFWLGPRFAKLSQNFGGNQAHNGYLELYLNLGWAGLGVLAVLLVTGFRNIVRAFGREPDVARLRLALFTAAVIYNYTEGAFKMMTTIWILLLFSSTRPLAGKAAPAAAAGRTEPARRQYFGQHSEVREVAAVGWYKGQG